MSKHLRFLSVIGILWVSFLSGLFINEGVYSRENDYYKGEEFINVTVYEKINPAIVLVEAQLTDGLSSGTGCIINKSGIILTSSHVVDKASFIEVTTANGETYKAEIVKCNNNESKDLALLQIKPKKPLPIIKLGDSSVIKVGQKVLAIGNPFGFNGTLTTGIVSRIDYERNRIQTDAAINPGSSGGPILNANGEVIGINNMKLITNGVEGMGFAIPIEEASAYADAIINGKNITRPTLGITMSESQNGVLVSDVTPGSAAASAGLQKGDIITAINDEKVVNMASLKYALYKYEVGNTVTIHYLRNGKAQTAKLKLT